MILNIIFKCDIPGTPFLIVDEFERVWNLLKVPKLKSGKRRLDIILDNSGEEIGQQLVLKDMNGKAWDPYTLLGISS